MQTKSNAIKKEKHIFWIVSYWVNSHIGDSFYCLLIRTKNQSYTNWLFCTYDDIFIGSFNTWATNKNILNEEGKLSEVLTSRLSKSLDKSNLLKLNFTFSVVNFLQLLSIRIIISQGSLMLGGNCIIEHFPKKLIYGN